MAIDMTYDGRDPHYHGGDTLWRSTGLWAAAGQAITVEVPVSAVGQGLRVQIGSHVYNLDTLRKDRNGGGLKRSPKVTKSIDITQASTLIASAFGGLIYIVVPPGSAVGTITVTIKNAGVSTHGQVRPSRRGAPSASPAVATSPGPHGRRV